MCCVEPMLHTCSVELYRAIKLYIYNIHSIYVCMTTSIYQETYPNHLVVGVGIGVLHICTGMSLLSNSSLVKNSGLVQLASINIPNTTEVHMRYFEGAHAYMSVFYINKYE